MSDLTTKPIHVKLPVTSASSPIGRAEATVPRLTNGNLAPIAVRTAAPYREFEAVFLQGFVEAMLPDNAESLFGKGLAGDTWKSFLAEKVAHALADSGQIGLAERLAASSARFASKK